jgi:hypothetical protein
VGVCDIGINYTMLRGTIGDEQMIERASKEGVVSVRFHVNSVLSGADDV